MSHSSEEGGGFTELAALWRGCWEPKAGQVYSLQLADETKRLNQSFRLSLLNHGHKLSL